MRVSELSCEIPGNSAPRGSPPTSFAERAGASARPAGMGFGGFAGSQLVQDVVAVDNSPSDQPSLAGLDPEVAQHLRRLAKRDPTTRLKAVQSLRYIAKNSIQEIL